MSLEPPIRYRPIPLEGAENFITEGSMLEDENGGYVTFSDFVSGVTIVDGLYAEALIGIEKTLGGVEGRTIDDKTRQELFVLRRTIREGIDV